MNLTEQETAVLDFYNREARGIPETTTLAGLTLPTFRAARGRLLKRGQLVRDPWGRYVPVGTVTG